MSCGLAAQLPLDATPRFLLFILDVMGFPTFIYDNLRTTILPSEKQTMTRNSFVVYETNSVSEGRLN